FRFEQDTRENGFSHVSFLPRCVFCFFSSRKEIVLPLLFRRKEAKENHLRRSFSSVLSQLFPRCYTKRTVRIGTVRFFVP
ncbi:MAG: hypothetical protein MR740_07860, partial [Clostridium sp.]|nr:hypothetical protein [Clostridium sp.]